jgi:hypothetical protein
MILPASVGIGMLDRASRASTAWPPRVGQLLGVGPTCCATTARTPRLVYFGPAS